MQQFLHKGIVFCAFLLMLAHDCVPHHHHYTDEVATQSHEHGDGHDHSHLPFAFMHIDDAFLHQRLVLNFSLFSLTQALLPSDHVLIVAEFEEHLPDETRNIPPPLQKFFADLSFRGPPTV